MTASALSGEEGHQRDALLAGMRKCALWLACAVSLWVLFYPEPRGAAVVAAIAVPFVLCGVVAIEAVHGFRRGSCNPVIGAGFASATLAMRALADVSLVEAETLIVPALVGGLALALVLNRSLRTPGWDSLAAITLLLAIHCAATLALANVMLDGAAPARLVSTVEEKEKTRAGKSDAYLLTLADGVATDAIDRSTVQVDASLYDSVYEGDTVCVDVGRGAFGLAWYTLDACAPG